MQFNGEGYSHTQYNTPRLRAVAHQIAKELPDLMVELDAQAVVVTGKSGIALAFAVLMLIDFPLVVVRKAGEQTHGSPVEGRSNVSVRRYIILDDFVSSGATVCTVVSTLHELARMNGEDIECVGVLQYLRDNAGGLLVDTGAYSVPSYGLSYVPT